MATLGAELGCERYLALTVVTGSGQRSSTFLAKLRRNSVFVLALRAFHCRPRRKKRATFTARVTSRMVDASRFSCGGQDRHRRLLCPRCQRPPRRRAAEQRDELAAVSITSSAKARSIGGRFRPSAHSITSSARATSHGGTSRPIVLAVCRLMTNSNFTARIIGRSAGFSPLRTRPV